MQVLHLLLNLASARLFWALTLESSLEKKITTSKRWEMDEEQWEKLQDSAALIFQEKRWKNRYARSGQKVATSLPHWHAHPSTACASHKDTVFWGETMNTEWPKRKAGGFRRKQRSCENCHSCLGNWKYFPSLPEWWFPDFNYFSILWEGYMATNLIWAWGNKTVNCTE